MTTHTIRIGRAWYNHCYLEGESECTDALEIEATRYDHILIRDTKEAREELQQMAEYYAEAPRKETPWGIISASIKLMRKLENLPERTIQVAVEMTPEQADAVQAVLADGQGKGGLDESAINEIIRQIRDSL